MEISLQLQQKQMLSLRQRQSVEILQMNALLLHEYAREMAEENPLMEWDEEADDMELRQERLLNRMEWLEEADEQNRSMYSVEHEAAENETDAMADRQGQTLRGSLLFQINTRDIPEGHKAVLRFLAESTAESGYLEADALEMMMERYPMKAETAERILQEFHTLEPVGVGARDLKECILLQLKQKGASPLAMELTEQHLDDIAKNRLSQLAKQLKRTMTEINDALQEIRACQPKPGSGFAGEEQVGYVIPDILVEKVDGELLVTVNGSVIPHLHISHAYVKILRAGADEKTEAYISEKLKQAEWAMQCISRRETTLQMVAESIVRRQERFFREKDGQLVPLRLADVAEEVGLHVSTVSRAVKEKYLQCDRGVFPLHDFFSRAMVSAEETVSADRVKERLKALIDSENKKKPFSDRELTEQLMTEGIQISRRTAAKYRESMGIAGASGRKSF